MISTDISYYLYETQESDSMLGQYLTYGIRVNQGEELYALYRDVSTDRKKVLNLVNRLNREQAAPYQLPELLEDLLP
ncbi:MAG: hypothetical protein IKV41_06575 [Oscillospiraceae bacterium]|nr:hypothetical protein [Oscillospiraceae bacterium]